MSNQENMTASPINEDTILVAELQADSPADCIRQMAEILSRQGIVKPEFVEAVLAREKEYPTGIPVGVPVALPHTDAEHCLKPAVIIGKMEQPVAFGMMGGEEDETVDVRLVFMLSLAFLTCMFITTVAICNSLGHLRIWRKCTVFSASLVLVEF